MKLSAKCHALLLRRLLEQFLGCVAIRALNEVDVREGGGSFRLPRRFYGTNSGYQAIYRLRAVPIVAAKRSGRWEMCAIPLFSLRVIISLPPVYLWPWFTKDGSATSFSSTVTRQSSARNATMRSP